MEKLQNIWGREGKYGEKKINKRITMCIEEKN
jgi:hypothetical protein